MVNRPIRKRGKSQKKANKNKRQSLKNRKNREHALIRENLKGEGWNRQVY
jgi:hypothetical protein